MPNQELASVLDRIARDLAARPDAIVALTPEFAARIEALTVGVIVDPDEPIEGDVAL
jgi:antitoxin PrlF